MRRTKPILLALALGAAVAGGGIALAETGGSSSTAARTSTANPAPGTGTSATINAVTATVAGKAERILVDAHGAPLYTYNADTPNRSQVTGTLAQLWPPLVSTAPTETGAAGKLSVAAGVKQHQVRYNGHFLYTFVDDTPGQVTGQGVQGFSVAIPDLNVSSGSVAPTPAVSHTGGYGY